MNVSEAAAFGRTQLLEEAARIGAHALLLVGPEDAGRDELARELAVRFGRLTPPYLDLWAREAPIPIQEVREAIRLAQEFPFQGAFRVLFVTKAERLSPVVQNALLRLVEEPPAHVRILFTAGHVAQLLPTLASRFVVWRLRPLPFDVFAEFGRAAGYGEESLRALYQQAGGWPVRVLGRTEEPCPGREGTRGRLAFAREARRLAEHPEAAFGQLKRLLLASPEASDGGARLRLDRALLLLEEAQDRIRRNQDTLLVFENLLLRLEEAGFRDVLGQETS